MMKSAHDDSKSHFLNCSLTPAFHWNLQCKTIEVQKTSFVLSNLEHSFQFAYPCLSHTLPYSLVVRILYRSAIPTMSGIRRRSFGIVGFAARTSWIHSPLDIGTSSTSTVDDEIPHSLQMMLCVLQSIWTCPVKLHCSCKVNDFCG